MSSLLERLGRKPVPAESNSVIEDNQKDELSFNADSRLTANNSFDLGSKKKLNTKEELDVDLEKKVSVESSKDSDLNSKLELLSKLNTDIDLNKALELLSSLSSQLNKNSKFNSNLSKSSTETNQNLELNKIMDESQSLDLNSDKSLGVNQKAELNLSKSVETTQHSNLGKVVDLSTKTELNLSKGGEVSPKLNPKLNIGKIVDLSTKADFDLDDSTKSIAKSDLKFVKNIDSSSELNSSLGSGPRLGLGSRLGLNTELSSSSSQNLNQAATQISIQTKRESSRSLLNSNQDQYQNLKLEIHRQIIEGLSVEQQKIITNSSSDHTEIEKIIIDLCNKVIDEDNQFVIPRADRTNIVNDIIDEVLGLGPIEPLLKDETISEIMINGPKMIYVERKGKLTLTNVQFQDSTHLMNIIERIVAPLGRRIDESSPLVDARLADGSRVNVIIPPLALNGACVTIRKFAKDPLTINNLISFGSLNEDMAALIKACVTGRLNIVVSGGTGSGKTTTLNVLSSFIPEDERIVTIEDAAELQLRQDHVVTLESRPANVEGNGQVAIRDLVRNALRMRPDRIVVGEVRSGEALDMLQAMNTGHDGSLTTAHANSPRDVLSRLETMVLMAGMELPVKAIREQIASAIDLIIQQSRLRDGSRKITYITEVQGMEGDVIVLQDLFYFEQDGLDEDGKLKGTFRTTGIRPKFLEKLETNGIKLDCSMFFGEAGWDE